MVPDHLRCNGVCEAVGISCTAIKISWEIAGTEKDVLQRIYEVQISEEADFADKKKVYTYYQESREQFIRVEALKGETQYYYRVRLYVNYATGEGWTPWSKISSFETAFSDNSCFLGKWVEAGDEFYEETNLKCKKYWKTKEQLGEYFKENMDQGLRSVPELVKEWNIDQSIIKARIYIAARGLYELQINGTKIGKAVLTPDFTAYDKCIYYQTYDITDKVHMGKNKLSVLLGDGWFVGHAQGIPGTNHLYGNRSALIFQVNITKSDGTVVKIYSDSHMYAKTSPIIYADLFMGEYHDELFKEKKYCVAEKDYDKKILFPQRGSMVEVIDTLSAVSCERLESGSWIVDFGQTIAGREVLELYAEEDCEVIVERSELLLQDGSGDIYNIIPTFPWHDQKNIFRIRGGKKQKLYPQFSYQGFRYLKITGIEIVTKEMCSAEVISTKMRKSCSFSSSNGILNRLVENGIWSQIGNMISIPTDCPQRERAGFTGDISIFAKTAGWNYDVEEFLARWLEQCRLEQLEKGQIPITVPYTKAYSEYGFNPGWTSAGWGDGIIFIPWDLYEMYGDKYILQANYNAMEKWMDYVIFCARETMPERYYMDFSNNQRQQYLWNTGFHWGDWQIPGYDSFEGARLTKEITASLFYYRQTMTMQKICDVLEKRERKNFYHELSQKIKEAFTEEYIKDGRLTTEFQGLYCMALAFGIIDGKLKEQFVERLNELIVENNYHLQTGFLGTPWLLDVLWENSKYDTAYRLLYQDTPPSWFYEVKKGATTIWEEWEGQKEDGTLVGSSFNHYAFGCVNDFIYRRIGGIKSLEPGFRKILIKIEAEKGLHNARFSYHTPQGKIQVFWEKTQEGVACEAVIPHNTIAVLECMEGERICGSGKVIWKQPLRMPEAE